MKALADYIHQRGLKFGLYSSAGSWTCEPKLENRGFPGGLGHEKQDAASFASFGVDYLKYDNCNNEKVDAKAALSRDGRGTAYNGRPIFYSLCEMGSEPSVALGGRCGHWRQLLAHDGRHQGHL